MTQVKERPNVKKGTRAITKEELEMTAYFHWLDRGCPADDPMTDWIEAEKKLRQATQEAFGKKS